MQFRAQFFASSAMKLVGASTQMRIGAARTGTTNLAAARDRCATAACRRASVFGPQPAANSWIYAEWRLHSRHQRTAFGKLRTASVWLAEAAQEKWNRLLLGHHCSHHA
jgi:hypothetical protein